MKKKSWTRLSDFIDDVVQNLKLHLSFVTVALIDDLLRDMRRNILDNEVPSRDRFNDDGSEPTCLLALSRSLTRACSDSCRLTFILSIWRHRNINTCSEEHTDVSDGPVSAAGSSPPWNELRYSTGCHTCSARPGGGGPPPSTAAERDEAPPPPFLVPVNDSN